MIEVFKTNINCAEKANQLLEQLHTTFLDYKANFDLEDCDRILRIVSNCDNINAMRLLEWLKNYGCCAEILPG